MKPTTGKRWSVLAGLSGAIAVAVSAWASHGLARTLPPELLERALAQAQSATQLHMVHSLALLAVAIWLRVQPQRCLHVAAALFSAGIVCFSLGIYVLHLWWPALGTTALRNIVPLGGGAFILGWLALAVAGLHAGSRQH